MLRLANGRWKITEIMPFTNYQGNGTARYAVPVAEVASGDGKEKSVLNDRPHPDPLLQGASRTGNTINHQDTKAPSRGGSGRRSAASLPSAKFVKDIIPEITVKLFLINHQNP
jgi:hypothetical protein